MNGNHWCLIIVDLKLNEICYFDPFIASEIRSKQVFDNVATFLRSTKTFKKKKFSHRIYTHQPQRDGCNCGVFICSFFQILLVNNPNLFENEVNDSFRSEILKKIQSKSYIDVCCVCKKKHTLISSVFKNASFIKLNCGHVFHQKCLKSNSCVFECDV